MWTVWDVDTWVVDMWVVDTWVVDTWGVLRAMIYPSFCLVISVFLCELLLRVLEDAVGPVRVPRREQERRVRAPVPRAKYVHDPRCALRA